MNFSRQYIAIIEELPLSRWGHTEVYELKFWYQPLGDHYSLSHIGRYETLYVISIKYHYLTNQVWIYTVDLLSTLRDFLCPFL